MAYGVYESMHTRLWEVGLDVNGPAGGLEVWGGADKSLKGAHVAWQELSLSWDVYLTGEEDDTAGKSCCWRAREVERSRGGCPVFIPCILRVLSFN